MLQITKDTVYIMTAASMLSMGALVVCAQVLVIGGMVMIDRVMIKNAGRLNA